MILFFEQIVLVSWWRVCYPQGYPFSFYIISWSWAGSLSKAWLSNQLKPGGVFAFTVDFLQNNNTLHSSVPIFETL